MKQRRQTEAVQNVLGANLDIATSNNQDNDNFTTVVVHCTLYKTNFNNPLKIGGYRTKGGG
jgi:hypothetical protein